MELDEEKNLIERAKSNPNEFFKIVDNFYKDVFNYIYKRTLNREVAKDLTQETFLKFFINLNKYKLNSPIIHYLIKISTNEINMYLRKKKEINIPVSSFDCLMDDKEKINVEEILIKSSLLKIKSIYNTVLTLHFFEGLNAIEIGKIIGKSENAVKILISRGLKKLKKEIENMKRNQGFNH